jgi:hypothetical protein
VADNNPQAAGKLLVLVYLGFNGCAIDRELRTFLTTGRTQGFALSSRYAPIPCNEPVDGFCQ